MADPVEEEVNKTEEENKAAEVARIAKEVEEKIKASQEAARAQEPELDPAELINTPDFKAKAKEATGMTDAQVDFVIKAANAASAKANANAAILAVKANHPGDFTKFEKAINDELKNYPVDKRGNTAIIEKLYYVEKGKEAEKGNGRSVNKPAIRSGSPTGEGYDSGSDRGGNNSLDDEERYVARKMGVSEKDYAKSKTTKLINDLIE